MGNPVLFKQTRIGKNEKPFILYKFRSMRAGSEADHERLCKFGIWLRTLSLDELPQLWNVISGDMSLVGPRPLLPEYLPRYSQEQRRRHEVRPGLTGLAQISGRNQLTWKERFALDVRYVDSLSFWLDLLIIAKTFIYVVKREAISADGTATMTPFLGND